MSNSDKLANRLAELSYDIMIGIRKIMRENHEDNHDLKYWRVFVDQGELYVVEGCQSPMKWSSVPVNVLLEVLTELEQVPVLD